MKSLNIFDLLVNFKTDLMRSICIFLSCCFALTQSAFSQENESVTVRAGTKILSYFPVNERYQYPGFVAGRVVFRNDLYSERRLNYNYLLGEVEFIQARDTLTVINKKDIKYISVGQDTFYYDKCYLKQIKSGTLKLALRDFIELKEIQNKDSYGIASSGGATTSYGSMPLDGNFYKLNANKDMVFQRTRQYYIKSPGSEFTIINRKNLLQLFPSRENEIKSFIKNNKIRFDKEDDILRLNDFLINPDNQGSASK